MPSETLFPIPRPKQMHQRPDVLNISGFKAQSSAVIPESAVVRTELRRLFGNHQGALLSLDCRAGAVIAPRVPEQAYQLAVNAAGVAIAANTAIGVLYALQTLRQLKIAPGVFRGAEIFDYPDVELRIGARPLLCGESGRNALEWGDGRSARLGRWRREIDFALQCRCNGIFAHGFDWNTRVYPGFARDMRQLNRYARQRGVKLIFGGYGIGVGGWGGDAYLGEAHNFLKGAGHRYHQDYPCSQNNPAKPETAYNGTCRSNPELRQAKIAEIAAFIRAVEPGALYLHHEDLSDWQESLDNFWLKRCPACRAQWPDDRMESVTGGAGAIADSYDVPGEARALVSKAGYDAAEDCTLLLTSPCYGQFNQDDATWEKLQTLWINVAKSMKFQRHVGLTLREQLTDADGRLLFAGLAEKIQAAGCHQKLFVFAVGGGALYGDNAPFSSMSEFNSYFSGAGALFNFSGVLFQRPQQLFNSECCWNLEPGPHSETLAIDPDRKAAADRYTQMAGRRQLLEPRHAAADGWLAQACRRIYGNKAGDAIFRYQLLRTAHGDYPLSVLYMHLTMEKPWKKLAEPPDPRPGETLRRRVKSFADECDRWRELAAATGEGKALIDEAIRHLRADWKRTELIRQSRQLEIGQTVAMLMAELWARRAGTAPVLKAPRRQLAELRRLIAALPADYPSLADGDAALYGMYCDKLTELL